MEKPTSMATHAVHKDDLPFVGSSYQFVGEDQGQVAVSMFLVEAQTGRGAPLHFHAYDEILLVQEGQSCLVIGDAIQKARPGDIVVIKANTPHGFVNIGPGVLKQIDIHLNPRFEQVLLPPTEASRMGGLPE